MLLLLRALVGLIVNASWSHPAFHFTALPLFLGPHCPQLPEHCQWPALSAMACGSGGGKQDLIIGSLMWWGTRILLSEAKPIGKDFAPRSNSNRLEEPTRVGGEKCEAQEEFVLPTPTPIPTLIPISISPSQFYSLPGRRSFLGRRLLSLSLFFLSFSDHSLCFGLGLLWKVSSWPDPSRLFHQFIDFSPKGEGLSLSIYIYMSSETSQEYLGSLIVFWSFL